MALLLTGILLVSTCVSCSSETATSPPSLETSATVGQTPGETTGDVGAVTTATGDMATTASNGGAAALSPSDSSVGSLTRVTEPFGGTGTTVVGRFIRGVVMGTDDKPVSGATVNVVIDAADPLYRSASGRLVGTVTTDAAGAFQVPVAVLPLGSIVDVTVVKVGYTSVFVYGAYDKAVVQVDFRDFGSHGGDRRMPVGDQVPPLPYEGLLPGGSGTS